MFQRRGAGLYAHSRNCHPLPDVVQDGDAPEPPDTSDVNGYEFDGSTQFKYVNFADALRALE